MDRNSQQRLPAALIYLLEPDTDSRYLERLALDINSQGGSLVD